MDINFKKLFFIFLVMLLFLWGCGEKPQDNDLRYYEIHTNNFKFEPSEILVKKGDRVKILLINDQGFHDFVIDKLNIKAQRLDVGFVDVIEFTAKKKGEFQYYCSVGDHKERGMVGKLIVED